MKQSRTLEKLRAAIVPGKVYRRGDLSHLSSNIDRHLATLVADGTLIKPSQGLYTAPRQSLFGEVPPAAQELVNAFLKDIHFVVYGPSQFNSLGLGTTQLYNQLVVFNRKRVGEYVLGGRTYTFRRWREAPKTLSAEFLVVELLNRLSQLPEDQDAILARLKEKLHEFSFRKLKHAVEHYGTITAKRRFFYLKQYTKGSDAA